MSRQFQNQLLGFMRSGRVDVEQQRRQYHFKIEGAKVFATCNGIRKFFLPRYSEQQFIEVAIKVLPKIGENLARYIGFISFRNGGDIRHVISID